jgi:hypothetical protein
VCYLITFPRINLGYKDVRPNDWLSKGCVRASESIRGTREQCKTSEDKEVDCGEHLNLTVKVACDLHISQLEIKNFRNFGGPSFVIALKSFTLLLGENNVGNQCTDIKDWS